MKKEYKKPTMRVYQLRGRANLLVGSGDPIPGWGGEGN